MGRSTMQNKLSDMLRATDWVFILTIWVCFLFVCSIVFAAFRIEQKLNEAVISDCEKWGSRCAEQKQE